MSTRFYPAAGPECFYVAFIHTHECVQHNSGSQLMSRAPYRKALELLEEDDIDAFYQEFGGGSSYGFSDAMSRLSQVTGRYKCSCSKPGIAFRSTHMGCMVSTFEESSLIGVRQMFFLKILDKWVRHFCGIKASSSTEIGDILATSTLREITTVSDDVLRRPLAVIKALDCSGEAQRFGSFSYMGTRQWFPFCKSGGMKRLVENRLAVARDDASMIWTEKDPLRRNTLEEMARLFTLMESQGLRGYIDLAVEDRPVNWKTDAEPSCGEAAGIYGLLESRRTRMPEAYAVATAAHYGPNTKVRDVMAPRLFAVPLLKLIEAKIDEEIKMNKDMADQFDDVNWVSSPKYLDRKDYVAILNGDGISKEKAEILLKEVAGGMF